MNTPPIVLIFAGHDPCGGAGIQADIETLASHQCHACSVITALTVQDSRNVTRIITQKPQDILEQTETLLADLSVAAVKIGLIGSLENVKTINSLLSAHPDLPVVLDPVLAAGGGRQLADRALTQAITEQLVPLATVITPNSHEARQLTERQSLSDCARQLLASGAKTVLITGTHEPSSSVENLFFSADGQSETFSFTRLPHSYHGSGCTLASAVAGLLAHGLDPLSAVGEAQEFTWNALNAGFRPGRGQHLPDRYFWTKDD